MPEFVAPSGVDAKLGPQIRGYRFAQPPALRRGSATFPAATIPAAHPARGADTSADRSAQSATLVAECRAVLSSVALAEEEAPPSRGEGGDWLGSISEPRKS